jgi:hypothetical protein
MKRLIIKFLLLVFAFFVLPGFVRAQLGSSMVPVVDPNVIGQLEKISRNLENLLVGTAESFRRVNNLLSKILQTQFQQIATDVFADFTKAHQYIHNLTEMESFIEKRKEKVKNQEIYTEALQEAKIAGAYEGIQDFIKNLKCVNPRIKSDLADYLKDINREFNLSLKAEELLNNIPDCPSGGTTTITLRPSFFAWLTQPFKFNLAQTSQSPPAEEIPSITITPAFQETEDWIELNNLKNLSTFIIESRSQEKEKERKKEIGEIWPIEEKCLNFIGPDENINGGKPVCEKYEIILPGRDLEKFKSELALNNPLNNPAQSIDFFQSLIPYGLTQIGITTSSISTSSNLFNILETTTTDATKIKQLINKKCASYNLGPTERGESGNDLDKMQTAYTLCLREFIKQYEEATELLEKDIEDRKNRVDENQKAIENLITDIEKLKPSIDPNTCPGAYTDLEETTQFLEAKNNLYTEVGINLYNLSVQIEGLRNLINQISRRIYTILDEVFTKIDDILPFLDINVEQFITNKITQLIGMIGSLFFGVNIPLPILDQIKQGPLKLEKYYILSKLAEILARLNEILDPLATIVLDYNRTYYEFYHSGLTNASFLNDIYELNLIRQKLDAYERAIEKGQCSYGSSSEGISLIKNQVIVVESKKEQNKSFNFFALLKNMFKPRIVEIKNEK